jgi:hypothetical protein
MNLKEAFTLVISLPDPIDFGATPWGPRVFFGAAEGGRIEGDRLKAQVVSGAGGDWLLGIGDGAYNVPDLRHALRTDDGESILIRGSGFIEATAAQRAAVTEGKPTDFGDHYMRLVFTFETGSEAYSWLNARIFLGEGRFPARRRSSTASSRSSEL